jgi:hypothetical protein
METTGRRCTKRKLSPETQERNRQRAYDYYWANREHCIQRATNNNKLISSQLRADYTLKSLYGIECGWYQTTFEAQCGKCAICGRNNSGRSNSKRFCVDHNHITGEVRGLLCHPCNSGIGKLKDDISLLQSAIHYLQQYDKTIQN